MFSRTTIHSIYSLCYLNQTGSGSTVSSAMVAEALGIPREQTAKVLQRLNHAGLVRSVRGRRGGYVIERKLSDISLIEVLDALNPRDDQERLGPRSCKRESIRFCNAHRGLQRLNERVRKALAGESLEGLDVSVCIDTSE